MEQVPLSHILILSSTLFFLGVYGFFSRRNLITMLMDIVLMFRFEIILAVLILAIFIMSLRGFDTNVKCFLNTMNVLLLLNFIAGWLPLSEGSYFSDFFRTNGLIVLQKNIINLGLLLISLTSYAWLTQSKYRLEFYILMLSSIFGVYVMAQKKRIPSPC